MPTFKKKINFLESEEGVRVKEALVILVHDSAYNTGTSFSANLTAYPDNRIPFVDKHMNYLNAHPNVEPDKYLANLRLMTRLR